MSMNARRVIAGLGADGRSRVVADGPVEPLQMGTMAIAQLWSAPIAGKADSRSALAEGAGQFRFEQLAEPVYAWMLAEYAPGQGRDDPGMHFTDTADHFYVIEGEVVLVLEEEEVVLRAGDAGLCRAVMHGWRNDTDATARVITFVLPATPAVTPAVTQGAPS